MPSKRDPRKDPRPGDIHAGPAINLRVERITEGMSGIEYIEVSMAFYGSNDRKGTRKFRLEQFRQFISGEKVEVLHVAE